jgi:hypothetical protein
MRAQCCVGFGPRSRHYWPGLRAVLNRSNSDGGRILRGEGRDSLINPQRKGGETQNCLKIAQATGGRSLEKKRVQMHSQWPVKELYTQGHQSCLVKGPDLSGGTPDQTCLLRLGFSDLELVPEILAI